MHRKKNCWEIKKCGRNPGGEHVAEFGLCPVSMPGHYEGVNHGKHGGRFCWRIAGTLCGGESQSDAAHKLFNCLDCDFFKLVIKEEGRNFKLSPADLAPLQKAKAQAEYFSPGPPVMEGGAEPALG